MSEQYDVDINFNLNGLDDLNIAVDSLNQLKDSVEAVQPSTEQLGDSTETTGEKVEKMGDKSSESANDVNVLGDAISAVASLGLAAEFANTASAADNYNVSMAALSQVASNNGIALSNVTSAINQVTSATSIGGGQARSYFNMLMNLGVTNTDALAQSMIALKGQSAITGNSIDAMSSKLTTIVNGTSLSSRSLTQLGISLQQLASTNGVSVDEIKSSWSTMTADQKLEALNNAMKQNSSLVTTMNKTTTEQLQEVQNSWAALEITVGQSSTGMSQSVLGFTNGAVQGLNFAVKNIPFAATFASGTLAMGSLVTGAKPALDTFNSLAKTVSSVGKIISTLNGLISITTAVTKGLTVAEAINETKTAGTTAARIAQSAVNTANSITKGVNTAATWALVAAEYALSLPILLVVAAVVAAIAIFLYLYKTNANVRNSVNWLISVFGGLGTRVLSVVNGALKTAISIFNRIKSAVTSLSSGISGTLVGAWNKLSGAVNTAISPLRSAYNTLKGIADVIPGVSGLGNILSSIPSAGFSYSGVTSTGSAGFGNESLLNSTVNKSNDVNNSIVVNINGIIENDAKEWVVNSLNEHLVKENLIRGV